mgnify:CR=1 FL=1
MDKKFYAHTRPINENGVERTEYQLLSDHERGVGTLCGQFAEAFGAQAEGHEARYSAARSGLPHSAGTPAAASGHQAVALRVIPHAHAVLLSGGRGLSGYRAIHERRYAARHRGFA